MTTASTAVQGATEVIVQRIRQRRPEIGMAMISRYRAEIADYATLDEALLADVLQVSVDNLDSLLDRLQGPDGFDEGALESFRLAAVRRVHQGVSIEALLHAYRLWGQIVWKSILEAVTQSGPRRRRLH